MSVALEALGFILLGRPPKSTTILEKTDFSKRIKTVLAAYASAFGDLEETELEKFRWLTKKLESLNVASLREELF